MRFGAVVALTVAAGPALAAPNAGPVAQLLGAPAPVSNAKAPQITVTGDGVVSFRYRLDSGWYSDELPVQAPIVLDAELLVNGVQMSPSEFNASLGERNTAWNPTPTIASVTFARTLSDTGILFVLNADRVAVKPHNTVTLRGSNLEGLRVEMRAPAVPALPGLSRVAITNGAVTSYDPAAHQLAVAVPPVSPSFSVRLYPNDPAATLTVDGVGVAPGTSLALDAWEGRTLSVLTTSPVGGLDEQTIVIRLNGSLDAGTSLVSSYLRSVDPERDHFVVANDGPGVASFKIDANQQLFAEDDAVVSAIQALAPEFLGEPVHRKAWRFIAANTRHLEPISNSAWAQIPAQFFNSLGFGNCGDVSSLFTQVMRRLGYRARTWSLDGHTVPEVLVNDRWELWDPDWDGIYYYDRQGQIAGFEELNADLTLITDPYRPLRDVAADPANAFVYSQWLAGIYARPMSVSEDTGSPDWTYALSFDVPPAGRLEFPERVASQLATRNNTFAPSYTNAKLTVPRGWTGDVRTPLVVHAIGYEGPHVLSIIGRDAGGTWQVEPTMAQWVTDTMVPYTHGTQDSEGGSDRVTLSASKPATIRYVLHEGTTTPVGALTADGTLSAIGSAVYDSPIALPPNSLLAFSSVDAAGNTDAVRYIRSSVYDLSDVQRVSLSVSETSPFAQGVRVSVAAAASGGCGTYEYYFTVYDASTGTWSVAQAYSPRAAWTWDTSSYAPGDYGLQVWARNAGSGKPFEAYATAWLSIARPVSALSLAVDRYSPQVVGSMVTFTAVASGGSNHYEYYFTVRDPGGSWSVGQPYGPSPSWSWNTAGLAPGGYTVQVWARNVGSAALFEMMRSMAYVIDPVPPPATGVLLHVDRASPQAQGHVVTFTAEASGGSGTYEYYFTLRDPTAHWSAVQPYGKSPAFRWNTAGLTPGGYTLEVWARSAGSTARYEAVARVAYVLDPAPAPATGMALTVDRPSPQVLGQVVTFTAAALGGSGTYEYYFTIRDTGGRWSVAQAYGLSPVWNWNTAGLAPGAYTVQVWARSAGSVARYEVWRSTGYTIEPAL